MHSFFVSTAQRPRSRPIEVGFIQLRRRDPETGRWTRVLGTFAATKLTTPESIAALYGGGVYEVVARCSRNRRITARATLQIPGAPMPLEDSSPPSNQRGSTDEDAGGTATGDVAEGPHGVGCDAGTAPAIGDETPQRRGRKRAQRLQEQLGRGELHATVFRLFAKKASLDRIVRETRLPVEEVRRLWSERAVPLRNEVEIQFDRHTEEMARAAKEDARDRHERWRADREREREAARLAVLQKWLSVREQEIQLEKQRLARREAEPITAPTGEATTAATHRQFMAAMEREDGFGAALNGLVDKLLAGAGGR